MMFIFNTINFGIKMLWSLLFQPLQGSPIGATCEDTRFSLNALSMNKDIKAK